MHNVIISMSIYNMVSEQRLLKKASFYGIEREGKEGQRVCVMSHWCNKKKIYMYFVEETHIKEKYEPCELYLLVKLSTTFQQRHVLQLTLSPLMFQMMSTDLQASQEIHKQNHLPIQKSIQPQTKKPLPTDRRKVVVSIIIHDKSQRRTEIICDCCYLNLWTRKQNKQRQKRIWSSIGKK